MQKYIDQLVQDLELIASQQPQEAYIEIPPQMEDTPDIGELALVPFKPISEWAGLKAEMFPEMWQLDYDQCAQINKAVFKVYKNLKLDLIDKPDDIPEDWLYDVLSSEWDHYVQYLPASGMDLELCSGSWETCCYVEFCNYCGDEYRKEQLKDEEDFLNELPNSSI